ncbi:MAG: choice-of-anchor D domain-containing protein [Bacteroidales bacterium]
MLKIRLAAFVMTAIISVSVHGQFNSNSMPQASVSPDTLKATLTQCNDSVTVPITITNAGNGPLLYNLVVGQGFTDNFENGLSNWTLEGDWGLGTYAYDGDYSLASSPVSGYGTNLEVGAYLAQSMRVFDASASKISFQIYHEMYCCGGINEYGYCDNMVAQISVNGGSFQDLNYWSCWSYDWQLYTIDLSAYVMNGDEFIFRFLFSSDEYGDGIGVYIDDFEVVGAGPSADYLSFSNLNGLVPPFSEVTLPVSFSSHGLITGIYSGSFPLQTSDPSLPQAMIHYEFTLEGYPLINAPVSNYNFGEVMLNGVASVLLPVENLGCDTLHLTGLVSSNTQFSAPFEASSVLPDHPLLLEAFFRPDTVGPFTGEILLSSNAGPLIISLSGTGVIAPRLDIQPPVFLGTAIECGDSVLVSFTLNNTGQTGLQFHLEPEIKPMNSSHCLPLNYNYNCCQIGIHQFSLGDFSHSSAPAAQELNQDFSDSLVIFLEAGQEYPLSVVTSPTDYENVRVWIDYNNDGSFELNEQIYVSEYEYTFIHEDTILVPTTGIEKNTRLRLRVVSDNMYYGLPDACSGVYYGQYEDYAVIIRSGDMLSITDTLAPGDSLPVQFYAQTTGMNQGSNTFNIRIVSNDPLALNYLYPVHIEMTGSPEMMLSSALVGFDTLYQNEAAARTIIITNTACAPLIITQASVNHPDLSLSYSPGQGDPLIIQPGDSLHMEISLSTSLTGDLNAEISLSGNAADTSIQVHAFIKPSSFLEFEPQGLEAVLNSCNDSLQTDFMLQNTGLDTLHWVTATSNPGLALQFTGNENEAVVMDSVGTMPAQGTLEFWFTQEYTNYWQYMNLLTLSSDNFASTTRGIDVKYYYDNLEITVGDTNYAYNTYSAATYIPKGEWNHLAISWDRDADSLWIYFNGNLVTRSVHSYWAYGTMKMRLGMGNYTSYAYQGSIDELRFWEKANSGDAIRNLRLKSLPGQTPGLRGYWDMNDTSSTTLADAGPNGFHGSMALSNRVPSGVVMTPSPAFSPVSGSLAPGDSSQVTVTIAAAGLPAGTHQQEISFLTNSFSKPYALFPIATEVSGEPLLSVPTDSLAFDSLLSGLTQTDTLQLYNTGCDTLFISQLALHDSTFQVSPTSLWIPPYAQSGIAITFAPQSSGFFSDSLAIVSNTGNSSVVLTGQGLDAPYLYFSPDTLTIHAYACGTPNTATVTLINSGTDSVTYAAQPFNQVFFDTFEGDTSHWDFSSGSWRVEPGTGYQSDKSLYFYNYYSNVLSHTVELNKTLQVTDPANVVISAMMIQNLSCGWWGNDILRIEKSVNGGPWNYSSASTCNLYPYGLRTFPVYDLNQGDLVRFRLIVNRYGFYSSASIQIDDFQISGLTVTPGFSNPETSGTLFPGDSLQIPVSFHATNISGGQYQALLIVQTNSPVQPTIQVPVWVDFQGTPELSTSADTLQFPGTMVQDSAKAALLLINTGCDTLDIQAITNNQPVFSCSFQPLQIQPGDTAYIDISFHPSQAGPYTDTLQITSTGGNPQIILSGQALLSPVLHHSPDTLILNAACNDSISLNFELQNNGDTTLQYVFLPLDNQDLLAYYPFRGNVNDYSGNSRHLTNGGTQPSRGLEKKENTARSFQGQQNLTYINETDIGENLFLPHLSVSMWVHPTNPSANSLEKLFYLSYGMHLMISNGALYAWVEGEDTLSNYRYEEVEAPALFNQWFHLALTFNGTSLRLFVNGQVVAEESFQPFHLRYSNNYRKMGFGNEYSYYYYYGDLDEFRLYGRGLTPVEVRFLYEDIKDHYIIIDAIPYSGNISEGSNISQQVTVNTAYTAAGHYTGNIPLLSNDPLKKSYGIPYRLTVSGEPDLLLPAGCLEFGSVFVDATATDSVLLQNNGCMNLYISNIQSTHPAFHLDDTVFSIPAFSSRWMKVHFTPDAAGTYQNNLILTTNDGTHQLCLNAVVPGRPEILLSNNLVPKILACVSTDTAMLQITNAGDLALTYSIEKGSNADWLQLGYTSNILSPGSGSALQLTFDRTGLNSGIHSTFLSISSNDPEYPEIVVHIYLLVSNTFILAKLGNDTAFCQDTEITLYPGFFSTYLWSNGATTPSITVSQGGQYSVTVTDISGCLSSDTLELIQLIPPVVFAGSDTAACSGYPFELQAQVLNPIPPVNRNVILGSGIDYTNSNDGNPLSAASLSRRTQFLYNKYELNQAGIQRGYIKSIAFNLQNGGHSLQNFTVKIGEVQPNLVSALYSYANVTSQVFFASSLSTINGWNELTFDSAYYWDGNTNLVIQICHLNDNHAEQPLYQYTYMTRHVYGYNCSYCGDLCNYYYGYGSHLRPNVRMNIDADINQYTWTGPNNYYSSLPNPVLPPVTAASAGSYQIHINLGFGCEGSDSFEMSVNQSPDVQAVDNISMLGWDTVVLTAAVSLAPGPFTYAWTPVTGLSHPDSLTTEVSINNDNTYSLRVTSSNGCAWADNVNITVTSRYPLSGHLSYANAFQTSLGFSTAIHKDANGQQTHSSTSNASGDYLFPLIPVGQNSVTATSDRTPGGINATDALLVARHITGLQYQQGIHLKAADVNANGYLSAVDALLILHRTAGNLTTFPLGDWVFEEVQFNHNDPGSVINLRGLSVGDVNGSFNPGLRTSPNLSLETRNFEFISATATTPVHLRINRTLSLGALTLELTWDPELIIIENLDSQFEDLVYRLEEGRLRLAWSKTEGVNLSTGDSLVTLWVRARGLGDRDEAIFTLNGDCELADTEADVLHGEVLLLPSLRLAVTSGQGCYLGQNHPNPFSGITKIPFHLSEAGKVSFEVKNLLGETVLPPTEERYPSGPHYHELDISALSPGLYFYVFRFEGSTLRETQTRNMILSR